MEAELPTVVLSHCGHCQMRILLRDQEPEEQLLHNGGGKGSEYVNTFLVPFLLSGTRKHKRNRFSPAL